VGISDSPGKAELITISPIDRGVSWLGEHWIVVFGSVMGFIVVVPFLAPFFMSIGWNLPGRIIYFVYSFLCHQLPERSFFLFGPKFTFSLPEIQAAWQISFDPLILRQFVGNPEMGWKVAWSDRMVSMYYSLWLFGLIWYPFRKRIPRIPWWGLILFLLPMVIDGSSHAFSDLAGIGAGFRDANLWLATLTQNVFPSTFYAGDALGSFNSSMRLLTGVLFGLGMVWYSFPFLDDALGSMARVVEYKQQYQELFQKEKARILSGANHE
jgi:uncharacterized membrane protein